MNMQRAIYGETPAPKRTPIRRLRLRDGRKHFREDASGVGAVSSSLGAVMALCILLNSNVVRADPPVTHSVTRPAPITMQQLDNIAGAPVEVREVSDYVFGNYAGDLPSPPHADINPKRAFIVRWKDRPYRFVFAHEGSYCPWFEFPDSGAGVCWQFWEGNDGWAELFNDHGRKERNSFIDIIENTSERVWIRWTYFGVNLETGHPAYRATEDFWATPNGLVLRKQSYETLMPGDHRGYTREPIEMIGMCPVGKLWKDVLRSGEYPGEHHALAVLDAYSPARYDVHWKEKIETLWESTPRRVGEWKPIDDSKGVAMILPLKEGLPFCILGDASGYDHATTRLKDHSYADTGGIGWVSSCWDHWPIEWLNSQGHIVDAESLKKYPNHFSPMGNDMFALPNEQVERRDYYSLYGVGSDFEPIRTLAIQWLDRPDELLDVSKLSLEETK